jgi:four helix bundle protein
MRDFRQLNVWERAHSLTLDIYRATAAFPREEVYSITSQIRRCSASVAANIAEGCGRIGNGDFHRFLDIAAGSAVEVEYFLLLARDLKFVPTDDYSKLQGEVVEVQRMLASLIRKVGSARNASKKQPESSN